MAEKLSSTQKYVQSTIRDALYPGTFQKGLYPDVYGAAFLKKHWNRLSFLMPAEVKRLFMDRDFEEKDFRAVVEGIAAQVEDDAVTADWLAKELADARLAEIHIKKP